MNRIILFLLAGILMCAQPVTVMAQEEPVNVDFGDFKSVTLVTKAWEALERENVVEVIAYTDKVLELYEAEAKKMEESLKEYPAGTNEEIFAYWALNDVGTALFIKGQVLNKAGRAEEAKEAYSRVVNEFHFAQCWDPKGWFWKPADAAQEQLDKVE